MITGMARTAIRGMTAAVTSARRRMTTFQLARVTYMMGMKNKAPRLMLKKNAKLVR